MQKLQFFLFLFFNLSTLATYAQSSFVRTYTRAVNPSGEDHGASCIDLVGTTSYVIGGGMYSGCAPGALLYKIDLQGNVIWDTLETTLGGCWFTYVEGTIDDGFVALDDQGHLYKFNSNNTLQWAVSTNCTSSWSQYHSKLIETSSGYVITGRISGNAIITKVDLNGTPVFSKQFSNNPNFGTFAMGIKETSDGGYILTGYTFINSATVIYLVKTDSTGSFQWSKTYDGPGNSDYGTDILVSPDGGFVISACNIQSSLIGIIKTDSLGNLQWAKNYSHGPYNSAFSLLNTADNKILVSGWTNNYLLMKLDTNGSWIWTHKYFTNTNSTPSVIRNTNDGGFATVQVIDAFAPNRPCFIKTDSLGDVAGSCADSTAVAPLIQDITSQFTVLSWPNNATNTNTTVPYTSTLADDVVTSYLHCSGTLMDAHPEFQTNGFDLEIYPNPSSGHFSISSTEKIKVIRIYDVLGNEIRKMEAGNAKVEIDLSDFVRGIYFVKVMDEKENFAMKKIVLQ